MLYTSVHIPVSFLLYIHLAVQRRVLQARQVFHWLRHLLHFWLLLHCFKSLYIISSFINFSFFIMMAFLYLLWLIFLRGFFFRLINLNALMHFLLYSSASDVVLCVFLAWLPRKLKFLIPTVDSDPLALCYQPYSAYDYILYSFIKYFHKIYYCTSFQGPKVNSPNVASSSSPECTAFWKVCVKPGEEECGLQWSGDCRR